MEHGPSYAARSRGGIIVYKAVGRASVVPANSAAGISPSISGLLTGARQVAARHRPIDGQAGPCVACEQEWPCKPYRHAQRLLRESGQLRSSPADPDPS